jgi:hypothetical protein
MMTCGTDDSRVTTHFNQVAASKAALDEEFTGMEATEGCGERNGNAQ